VRTLALLLAAGAVSVMGVAASDPNSLFSDTVTSIAVATQNSSTGSIEYIVNTNLSAEQMLTVAADINGFKQERLEDNLSKDLKDQTIKDYDDKDIKFDYSVTFDIKHVTENNNNAAHLRITFGNYYSYVKFNDLTLAAPAKNDRSLFFIERTNKFNAYTRYFDTNGQSKKTAQIISEFIESFDKPPAPATKKTEYVYVLANSQRRSRTNAEIAENEFGSYNYYFKISDDRSSEVEIYDRRANTPIWYGLAVAATAAAMVTFYFVTKKRASRDVVEVGSLRGSPQD